VCLTAGEFGSDYGASRGGGPMKTAGFSGRAAPPYGGGFNLLSLTSYCFHVCSVHYSGMFGY